MVGSLTLHDFKQLLKILLFLGDLDICHFLLSTFPGFFALLRARKSGGKMTERQALKLSTLDDEVMNVACC